jgi:hypothetical protein
MELDELDFDESDFDESDFMESLEAADGVELDDEGAEYCAIAEESIRPLTAVVIMSFFNIENLHAGTF